MCIRDRVMKDGKVTEEVYKIGGLYGKAIEPVSYTHLDVYKRQV